MSPRPAPLAERVARYERIVAMHQQNMTLEAIGRSFDPPLSKQRVRQILAAGTPRRPGRPDGPDRLPELRMLLGGWESRRARWAAKGLDEKVAKADARISVLASQIAAIEMS